MIEVRGLTFAYPHAERPVLNDVTVSIQEGEAVLVVGPSGGGKSTFLRCLNGLVPHFHGGRFSGHVTTGGLDTLDAPAARPRPRGRHGLPGPGEPVRGRCG